MRVLLAHNFYLQAGGEDAVFRNEKALLEARGVEVVSFMRNNDALASGSLQQKLKVMSGTAWSRAAKSDLEALIVQTQPDVAHFHNTFPMLSPSVYAACASHGVPVVQTLHNYRTICPSATLFRDGRPCEDCVGKVPWPALRHRCYRGSLAGSAVVAWMLVRNRAHGVYDELVHRYIALTEFAAAALTRGGLPSPRIEVKSNFLSDPGPPGPGGGGYALYVGRLSHEKGVRVLLDAWQHQPGLPLKVAGDGPLRNEMEQMIRERGLDIEVLGHKSANEVRVLVDQAECLIVPSLWYEGFPMVIVEAYARGTPVAASAIGSLDEVVEEGKTGHKFPPGDAVALAHAVSSLVGDRDRLMRMREIARARFEANYTPDRNFEMLMGIYERAQSECRGSVQR